MRRESLQGPTAGRLTTAIERIFDWPARVVVVACVPPVPSPQAATNAPYPASPLSAAAPGQESRAALGCTRSASVNSTLNALHASVLFPPISAAHALADRSRYRLPSKLHMAKNTRPPAKSNIPHQNKGAGTIDDKTGNYRRAPGTIDDGKKTHETQEKTHPKLRQQGHFRTSTRNDYADAWVRAYVAPSSLGKTGLPGNERRAGTFFL